MNLLVLLPLIVKLLWEVALSSLHSSNESVWIEGELHSKLAIKVDEWLSLSLTIARNWVLSADLGDKSSSSIWQLDVLLVQLEVLTHGNMNVSVVENLLVDDVAHILENHVDLTHWRALNEVLDNLNL